VANFFIFKKNQNKKNSKKNSKKNQKIEKLTRGTLFNVVTIPLTERTTLRSNFQNRDQIEMKKIGTILRFHYENRNQRYD